MSAPSYASASGQGDAASGTDSDAVPAAKRICQSADDRRGDCLGSAPPFDEAACGNPRNPQKAIACWKTRSKKLPEDYWSRKRDGTPSIDAMLQFLKLRKDVNGDPVADKLGPAEQMVNGWWRLPFRRPSELQGINIEVAWHVTRITSLYSVLFYEELSESTLHTKQMRAGVYCHGSKTASRAEYYMVFEDVFSIGAWWGVKLELLVDRDRGVSCIGQWVQPADSISLQAVWLCGLDHEQMLNTSCFVPTP